ncbi:H repeat-containing Rhs element protein [Escherichia coli]|nr:H repeat-containing Rhs element protein [Escherichia coli]
MRLHIVCDVPDELIEFTFEWKGLKKYAWQSPFGQ